MTPIVVTTQHNDELRTGANLQEITLDTSNVNPEHFGKLFTYPVQGNVYAQPLYVSDVTIPAKGSHNVVYVATMNNRVFAFDADDPTQAKTPIWQRQLLPSIPLPDQNIGPSRYFDISGADAQGNPAKGEVGILSTPVISLAHQALYVVTASKVPNRNDPGAYSHHLHALNMSTGADMFNGPVQIHASFKGSGYSTGRADEQDTVVGGNIIFVSHRQLQRSALLLVNDTIYIAFASYGDKDAYHGWVLAYNASTLMQVAVFNTTPNGMQGGNARLIGKGGIWQAGQGLAADEQNNIYFLTANGGFQDGTNFGDSFVKLSHDLAVLDWFSPFNQAQLAEVDADVGSAGPLLLPGTNLLIGGGKESKFFLVDRDKMGHFNARLGNSQIAQNFYIFPPENPDDPMGSARKGDGFGHHVHGGPVYWRGPLGPWIYIWVEEDVLKAFALLPSGIFDTQPTPRPIKGFVNPQLGIPISEANQQGLGGISGISSGMPGGMLSLSANGDAAGTGILWASHPLKNANQAIVSGVVRAYDASDLTRELWNSDVNAQRDSIGKFAKFCPPTVANGRVYMASFSDEVVVYGLL